MFTSSIYLKTESYYNDLYDLGTIENCLHSIHSWEKAFQKRPSDEEIKNLSDEEFRKGISVASNIEVYVIKGERYRQKKSTIDTWMERDRRRDEKLASIQEPPNILCPHCAKKMTGTFKDLYDLESMRVLFFFECPLCKKRRGVFDNGEKFVSKSQRCPQCDKDLTVSCTQEKRVLTWVRNCSSCDFNDIEIDDFDKKQAEWDAQQRKDQELLNKHRAAFCLSEEDGQEYIYSSERLKEATEYLEKTEQKRMDPDYQKVLKLKKLTVVELEKLVSEMLAKEKYIKLAFDRPEMGKYVIVPFTVQDADSSRKERDSESKLRRTIKKALQESNWRLMSEGIMYRLGYLSGRLKGYEQEEDLMQLVKQGFRS